MDNFETIISHEASAVETALKRLRTAVLTVRTSVGQHLAHHHQLLADLETQLAHAEQQLQAAQHATAGALVSVLLASIAGLHQPIPANPTMAADALAHLQPQQTLAPALSLEDVTIPAWRPGPIEVPLPLIATPPNAPAAVLPTKSVCCNTGGVCTTICQPCTQVTWRIVALFARDFDNNHYVGRAHSKPHDFFVCTKTMAQRILRNEFTDTAPTAPCKDASTLHKRRMGPHTLSTALHIPTTFDEASTTKNVLRQLVAHACDMLGAQTHSYSADVWQTTKTQARSPQLIVEYVPTRMHDNGKGERTGCLLALDREARLWHHRKQLLISVDRLQEEWYDRKQRRLMMENIFGNGGIKYVAIVVLHEIGAFGVLYVS